MLYSNAVPHFEVSALATGDIIISNEQQYRKPDFRPKFRLTHNICAKFEKSVRKSERAFYIFEKFSDLSLFFTIFLLFSHLSYETVKKIPPTGGAVSGKEGRKTLAGNSTLLLYYTLGGLINGNS